MFLLPQFSYKKQKRRKRALGKTIGVDRITPHSQQMPPGNPLNVPIDPGCQIHGKMASVLP